jgi:hypothetical protein
MGMMSAFDPQFWPKSFSLIYPDLKTPVYIQDHTENGLQESLIHPIPLPSDSV